MRRLAIVSVTASLLALSGESARLAFAQESIEGQVQSVNGMQMYYEVRGTGPPLVLLHGFFGCGKFWQPVIQQFSKRYRVVTPDLRGHGRSTNPSDGFTHRQSARDVFALLDRLGIKQFKAMGLSSGGMTLLHMATQQPDRVEAMILIGATIYITEPARQIMNGISPDNVPPEAMEFLRECVTRGKPQIRELVSEFHRFKDSYDDMNFTPPHLQRIAARTLIVHGDRDALHPIEIPLEMYQSIPRSYLWIVPNGPHVVPIVGDMADQFQTIALNFLSGRWENQ
ncbi:MAG TPA: alpha/beta hydrolase [Steroidobacteraceae bacterium]|nr:alpha/beta hydrolase [Steroidobacteraceae bacterium]